MLKYLLAVIFLTSCQETYLSVHTDYLSHINLASYHVGTPDPLLNNPPIGQRLIVMWSIPPNYLYYENLHLLVTIRLRNREQINENIEVVKRRGTFVYPLLNEDYLEKGGILTYKVDLIGDEIILEEWRHQIWNEQILLNQQIESSEEVWENNDEVMPTPYSGFDNFE